MDIRKEIQVVKFWWSLITPPVEDRDKRHSEMNKKTRKEFSLNMFYFGHFSFTGSLSKTSGF